MTGKIGRNVRNLANDTRPFVCEIYGGEDGVTITNKSLFSDHAAATFPISGANIDVNTSQLCSVEIALAGLGDETADGDVSTACDAEVTDIETGKTKNLEPGGNYSLEVEMGQSVPEFSVKVAPGAVVVVCGVFCSQVDKKAIQKIITCTWAEAERIDPVETVETTPGTWRHTYADGTIVESILQGADASTNLGLGGNRWNYNTNKPDGGTIFVKLISSPLCVVSGCKEKVSVGLLINSFNEPQTVKVQSSDFGNGPNTANNINWTDNAGLWVDNGLPDTRTIDQNTNDQADGSPPSVEAWVDNCTLNQEILTTITEVGESQGGADWLAAFIRVEKYKPIAVCSDSSGAVLSIQTCDENGDPIDAAAEGPLTDADWQ